MADTPQTQQETSGLDLDALAKAIKLAQDAHFVTPEENEAKVKAAASEAKKLLKALRGDDSEEETEEEVVEQQFGMGPRPFTYNANITPDEQRQIDLATEQFKQSVQRVDNQILAQYIQAIQNGDYAAAETILENAVESQQVNTLMFALLTIGAILLPLYARQRLAALFRQFGLQTVFASTRSGEEAMRKQAERGAKSHVKTIAKDIKNTLDDAIIEQITSPDIEAKIKDKYEALIPLEGNKLKTAVISNQEIYKFARDAILAGDSRQAVIQKLQENFTEVGQRRANVIASNEANRVFTMSQFDADQQFLAQNKLTSRAYKRLVSNTGHPEAICKYIIDKTAANPIPFTEDFVKFGSTLTVKDNGKTYKFKANYEKLRSGHIHVNCHCRYELLIKQDDGTWLNTYDGKVFNAIPFDEKKHKRDKDGKFAKKAGLKDLDLSAIDNVKDFNKMVETAYFEGSMGHHNEEVTDSVRAYQGHFYDAINIHARAQMLDDPLTYYGNESTYGEVIDNIDAAANMTLSSNVLVYRGTEIPHHQLLDVGEKLNARSFLSTSVDQKVAKSFQYKGGSMFVITAKKGQKVIIPDYVTYGKRGRTMGEAEVLMPSESVLTVTKIDGDTVYAELN